MSRQRPVVRQSRFATKHSEGRQCDDSYPCRATCRYRLIFAIFVSLGLSKSTWLVTALSPGSDRMSRHSLAGGDMPGLVACLEGVRGKARTRMGVLYPVIVIPEAGLDGF